MKIIPILFCAIPAVFAIITILYLLYHIITKRRVYEQHIGHNEISDSDPNELCRHCDSYSECPYNRKVLKNVGTVLPGRPALCSYEINLRKKHIKLP